MAYPQRGSGPKKGKSVRLTGLFKAKNKDGLLTGSVKGAELDGLIEKIKEAKASGNGIVFFCWRQEGNPPLSLSVDVSKPYEGARQPRSGRKVEPADDFDSLPEADDLFN